MSIPLVDLFNDCEFAETHTVIIKIAVDKIFFIVYFFLQSNNPLSRKANITAAEMANCTMFSVEMQLATKT